MEEAPTRKRRRPALSCLECRRRKIKCDREQPCKNCTQGKVAECVFASDAPPSKNRVRQQESPSTVSGISHGSAATPGTLPEQRIPRYDTSCFGNRIAKPGKEPTINDCSSNSPGQRSNNRPNYDEAVERRPDQAITSGHPSSLDQQRQLLARDLVTIQGSTPELQGVLSKTRLYGPAHYKSSFEQFDQIRAFASGHDVRGEGNFFKYSGRASELHAILQKCKDLAKQSKGQRSFQWQLPQDPRECVPSRDVADELKAGYFRVFESTYRILHIPSFERQYERYWSNPAAADDCWVYILLLVLAIGSCFVHDTAWLVDLRPTAAKWIYHAQSWLSAPFHKSRLSHAALQLHCLLLLARYTNYVGPELVWISAGALVRMATQMGLHRDPTNYPKMSPFNVEIRRRLWATALEMALQSSLDSGLPPLLSQDDYDTLAPKNINDSELEEDSEVGPSSKPSTTYTQTSLQIILQRSLPKRLAIARLLNHFRSRPSYEDVLRLSSDISELLRGATKQIQTFQTQNISPKPSVAHQNLIQLSLRRFLIALHLPFSVKARKDPHFYFSRKVCLEQALVISTPKFHEDFQRLLSLGGGMYREILTLGAFGLCLELITQLEEDSANLSVERNTAQRNPYRDAIQEVIDLAEGRLRLGETNIKGYLFLSMALGQINAMEGGEAPEEGIFYAAKSSATKAYDIINSRLAWKFTSMHNGYNSGEGQLGASSSNPIADGMTDPLPSNNIDFNFDQLSSWLYPTTDEIPWASLEDFPADFQV